MGWGWGAREEWPSMVFVPGGQKLKEAIDSSVAGERNGPIHNSVSANAVSTFHLRDVSRG